MYQKKPALFHAPKLLDFVPKYTRNFVFQIKKVNHFWVMTSSIPELWLSYKPSLLHCQYTIKDYTEADVDKMLVLVK